MMENTNTYCQTSNISSTLVGDIIVDHSDVVGASPCRRSTDYIFILGLTPGFNGLHRPQLVVHAVYH